MKNLSAILWLFAANLISGVAQGISIISIPWYFAKQEETRKFAIIYLLINVVTLFWGPLSGTLVDKYNRRNLFLAITATCGTLLFGIAGLGFYLGALPWYMVGLVLAVTFFNFNIHYPALYAFVQEITEPKHYGKISSLIEVQGQTATMLAGAGAALLLEGAPKGTMEVVGLTIHFPFTIESWTIHEIFLLDACTYVVAFFMLFMIRFQPTKIRKPEIGTIRERFRLGYDYLKKHPLVLTFGIASYSVFVTMLLSGFYLISMYVANHLQRGGDVYASFEVVYAIGAISAGFGINWVFQRVSKVFAIICLTLACAFMYFILALSTSLAVFFSMMVVLGLTNAGVRVLRINYLFENIDNQYFGRAGSIFFISNVTFRILFLLVFWLSFFHESNHVIYAFVILGVFLLASAAVLVYVWRKMFLKQPDFHS